MKLNQSYCVKAKIIFNQNKQKKLYILNGILFAPWFLNFMNENILKQQKKKKLENKALIPIVSVF